MSLRLKGRAGPVEPATVAKVEDLLKEEGCCDSDGLVSEMLFPVQFLTFEARRIKKQDKHTESSAPRDNCVFSEVSSSANIKVAPSEGRNKGTSKLSVTSATQLVRVTCFLRLVDCQSNIS